MATARLVIDNRSFDETGGIRHLNSAVEIIRELVPEFPILAQFTRLRQRGEHMTDVFRNDVQQCRKKVLQPLALFLYKPVISCLVLSITLKIMVPQKNKILKTRYIFCCFSF